MYSYSQSLTSQNSPESKQQFCFSPFCTGQIFGLLMTVNNAPRQNAKISFWITVVITRGETALCSQIKKRNKKERKKDRQTDRDREREV